MSEVRNIILAGFMGTGKTTVGRLLAGRLGWSFVDTDQWIETRRGQSIGEIFNDAGEERFRQLEAGLAQELRGWDHSVVATGGGFFLRPENLSAALAAGPVILLVASPDEIWHRVGRSRHRPLLQVNDPRARIESMLEERREAYDRIPTRIPTDGRPPAEIADEILNLLGLQR